MFQYLKRRLGIDDLEKQIQLYANPWREIGNCLSQMNDQLLDINVSVKYQASYGIERHNEVMARLGMILTDLEKVLPKEKITHKFSKKGKNKDE
jgi:hypothetical protein